MANYINPIDLIADYIKPPFTAINTGIDQGVKIRNLWNAEAQERSMAPYRAAQAAQATAAANEKAETSRRLNEAIGRLNVGGGGSLTPGPGGFTPQQLIDLHLTGVTNPALLQPVDTPVADAGGVMRTVRGGASTFVPTAGLPPKQTKTDVTSGDETQSVLMGRSGETAPLILPGGGTAIPGPRFAPKADKETWSEPYAGPDGAMLQESSSGQVRSVIGRKPAGSSGTDGDIAKSANLSAMRKLLSMRMFASLPADKRETLKSFIDPFSGTINPEQVFASMDESSQKVWIEIGKLAAENAKTMSPEAAVDKAMNDDGVKQAVGEYRETYAKKQREALAKSAEELIQKGNVSAEKKKEAAATFNQNSLTHDYAWKDGFFGGDWEKQPKKAPAAAVTPPEATPTPAAAPPAPAASSSPGPQGMSKTTKETITTVGAPKKRANTDAILAEANKAIAAGADPEKVKQRLKDVYGITVK